MTDIRSDPGSRVAAETQLVRARFGDLLESTPDAIVLVNLRNLERGRYYRLELLYGTAPNRRGSGLLIHCEE